MPAFGDHAAQWSRVEVGGVHLAGDEEFVNGAQLRRRQSGRGPAARGSGYTHRRSRSSCAPFRQSPSIHISSTLRRDFTARMALVRSPEVLIAPNRRSLWPPGTWRTLRRPPRRVAVWSRRQQQLADAFAAGFCSVVCGRVQEADWPDACRVNRYVRGLGEDRADQVHVDPRPGDRTGARSSCVALAHPKRRGVRPRSGRAQDGLRAMVRHWHPENDGGVRHCGGGWTSRRDLRGPQIRAEHLVPDPIRRHPPFDQRRADVAHKRQRAAREDLDVIG